MCLLALFAFVCSVCDLLKDVVWLAVVVLCCACGLFYVRVRLCVFHGVLCLACCRVCLMFVCLCVCIFCLEMALCGCV